MVTIPRGRRGRGRLRAVQDEQGQPSPTDYMMALAAIKNNTPMAAQAAPPAAPPVASRAPTPMQEAPEIATPEQNIGVMGGSR
jgi:hypothetical protein